MGCLHTYIICECLRFHRYAQLRAVNEVDFASWLSTDVCSIDDCYRIRIEPLIKFARLQDSGHLFILLWAAVYNGRRSGSVRRFRLSHRSTEHSRVHLVGHLYTLVNCLTRWNDPHVYLLLTRQSYSGNKAGLRGGVHPSAVCPNCARDMRFWLFWLVWLFAK